MTAEQPAGTIVQRLRASGLAGVSWIASRLPEAPLIGLADMAGRLTYRLSPQRAAQARLNLRRIVDHLVATGTAEPRIAAAPAAPPTPSPQPPTPAGSRRSSGPPSATTLAITSR